MNLCNFRTSLCLYFMNWLVTVLCLINSFADDSFVPSWSVSLFIIFKSIRSLCHILNKIISISSFTTVKEKIERIPPLKNILILKSDLNKCGDECSRRLEKSTLRQQYSQKLILIKLIKKMTSYHGYLKLDIYLLSAANFTKKSPEQHLIYQNFPRSHKYY